MTTPCSFMSPLVVPGLAWRRLLCCGLWWMVSTLVRAAPVAATPWPEMPGVPRGRVEWVAQQVWLNGVPARLQRFESESSVAEVVAHYQAHWSSAALAPRSGRLGDWHLVSILHGPFHLVMQVKPRAASGSEGLLSSVNLKALKSPYLPTDWPTLDGLQVRQVMESVDGPRHSHHMLARSDKRLSPVRDALMASLAQKGWRVQHEERLPDTYLATCERTGQTLDLVLTQESGRGGVNLVANWVQFQEAAP